MEHGGATRVLVGLVVAAWRGYALVMDATWRFVSIFTAVFNRLLVLGLAGTLIYDMVQEAPPGEPGLLATGLALVLGQPITALVVAAVLVVLNLNVVQFSLYSFSQTPARAFITSRAPGGTTRIALSAVQRALRATANQVPEIARAKVRVKRVGRSRFQVHVRYHVRDVSDAGTAAEHLRLVLKKRFSELVVLDPKDRVDFDLDMAGIKKVDGAVPEPMKLQAPPDVMSTESFKGPVYPVESEIT